MAVDGEFVFGGQRAALAADLGELFFTGEGGEETRAWTIPAGATALKAAGAIHSDLERGFIRAEIVNFADLEACGSMAAVRKKGLHRVEGKEYRMADGDIVIVRFNI